MLLLVDRFDVKGYTIGFGSMRLLLLVGRFDVKGYVAVFGSTSWKKTHFQTHEEAEKKVVVTIAILNNYATCVGKLLP